MMPNIGVILHTLMRFGIKYGQIISRLWRLAFRRNHDNIILTIHRKESLSTKRVIFHHRQSNRKIALFSTENTHTDIATIELRLGDSMMTLGVAIVNLITIFRRFLVFIIRLNNLTIGRKLSFSQRFGYDCSTHEFTLIRVNNVS